MSVTKQSVRERQIAVIQHYLARLETMSQMYAQGKEAAQEALRRFDLEWQQLKAQQQSASQKAPYDPEMASFVVAFPEAVKPLLMQIDVDEALIWLTDSVTWVDQADTQRRYDLLIKIYELHKLRLHSDAMRGVLNELEILAKRLDDDHRQIRVACLNAEYHELLYQYEAQLIWAEQALAMAMHIEEPTLIAEAQCQIGFAQLRLNRTDDAKEILQQSLKIYQSLGQPADEIKVRSALALNAYYAMEFEEAILIGEQARTMAYEIGDRTREVRMLSNLSLFAQGAGDPQKALEYGQNAWLIASSKGLLNTVWTALGSMIMTLGSLGLVDELHEYIGYIRDYMPPSEYMGNMIAIELVKIAYEYKDWQTSCRLSAEYALTDQQEEDSELKYGAFLCWGLSLIALNDWDEAEQPFMRAQELHQSWTGDPQMMSGVLAGLSFVQVKYGHLDKAQRLLDRFIALNLETGFTKLFWRNESICLAYHTAIMLSDSRSMLLNQSIKNSLEVFLSKLTDERLRTSYLNLYTIRQLCAIIDINTI